jgi:hypothetical protein
MPGLSESGVAVNYAYAPLMLSYPLQLLSVDSPDHHLVGMREAAQVYVL